MIYIAPSPVSFDPTPTQHNTTVYHRVIIEIFFSLCFASFFNHFSSISAGTSHSRPLTKPALSHLYCAALTI